MSYQIKGRANIEFTFLPRKDICESCNKPIDIAYTDTALVQIHVGGQDYKTIIHNKKDCKTKYVYNILKTNEMNYNPVIQDILNDLSDETQKFINWSELN